MNRLRVIVFNTTFNNFSVKSWWSVLLVEETGIPGEYHRSAASHWQTLSHAVTKYTLPWVDSNSQLQWWYMDRLHRSLYIQLPSDHDHDGILITEGQYLTALSQCEEMTMFLTIYFVDFDIIWINFRYSFVVFCLIIEWCLSKYNKI